MERMQGLDLDRVTDRGKLAGVCAGVADRWRIDPLLVRVGAVVLGLFSGVGAVLYAAAWALLPVRGQQEAPLMRSIPSARRVPTPVWIAIVSVLCLISLIVLSPVMPVSTGPVIGVAALWYFCIYRPGQKRKAQGGQANRSSAPSTGLGDREGAPGLGDRHGAHGASGPVDPGHGVTGAPWGPLPQEQDPEFPPYVPPPTGPAPTWHQMPHPSAHQAPVPPRPTPPPAPARTKARATHTVKDRAAKEPRPAAVRVRTLAFIAAGATVVVLAMLESAGLAAVPMAGYAATALLVVGLALVVSAWTGRARGLLPVGCGLAALTLIGLGTMTAPGMGVAGTGAPVEAAGAQYVRMDDLPESDAYDVGQVRIDLGQLDVDRDGSYEVTLDSGQLEIVVPPDTNLRIVTTTDLGSITLLDQDARSGLDLSQQHDVRSVRGGPVLTIRAHVDLGSVVVRYP
ncbi:MAG TPA: PspC domain-containing protein [Candidatus Avipropionibacterium avicola]|uniref:PspC domain-containing protein n=1 Tax=Candidatus Avipropionibacterium avicola TaxID=2840701 RepID=A0A9D1GZY1_9ACTN|nr:PspC domain-containing protein [Candidatus Avipropionibacterium avicola]